MSDTTIPPTSICSNLSLNTGRLNDPVYQAYKLLHVGFTIAPLVAGLDKFFDVLVNWDAYLAPLANRALAGHVHAFMLVVGVIEIIAGIGVALWPRIFSYVVAAWLLGIIVNLLLIPPSNPIPHYDVALRDFGLLLGALALARLSPRFAPSAAREPLR
jgi:uncharacterized membrane protein YphA (DoxX/SURF4 family)